MNRYQVDTRGLDRDGALVLFGALLRWAVARGDRFEIRIETGVYDDAAQVARLRALGDVTTSAPNGDALSRLLKRKFDTDYIAVRGAPGPAFIEEMTRTGAPGRVIVGDESPVDTVVISDGPRALYVAYDYGTVQVLELSDEEKAEAIRQLAPVGLSAEMLMPVTSKRS